MITSTSVLRRVLLAAVVAASLSVAVAGPEGSYTINGTSPGTGAPYAGTVTVERSGDTYRVVWRIGTATYIGSGLGATPAKDASVMGPASVADNVLAVGYISGPKNFGLAYYVQQDDGSWKGIWTNGGSEKIGTETWLAD